MLYHALGKTGLHISALGLGGHWPTADGRRYEDRFADDEVPAAVVRNRAEVVAACLDAGVNYIDITTAAEALAYGRVLVGRRDRVFIGADDYQWSARNPACTNVQALTANVERCLTRLRTDYLDIWRVTAEVHGRNCDADIEAVIATADRLRAAGKIRHLGLSSHHPGWLQSAVARFPAIDVVLMPCPLLGDLSAGVGRGQSVLAQAAHEVGVIGIKPFAGGAFFPTSSPAHGSRDGSTLASLALQFILQHRPEITCVVPGLSTVNEVTHAIAAATAPPIGAEQLAMLNARAAAALQALDPAYAWLAAWVSFE